MLKLVVIKDNSMTKIDEASIRTLLEHFPQGITYIDLETTGLSPLVDKIVEVSGIRILPDGDIKTFNSLINPGIKIPDRVIAIHHINDDMVKDAPDIKSILPDFLEFTGNAPIVAHNAKFDIGFIIFSIHLFDLPLPEVDIYDSCKFARAYLKTENFKLGTISSSMGISNKNAHRAYDDAEAGIQIFINTIIEAKKIGEEKNIHPKSYLMNLSEFKKTRDFNVPQHLQQLVNITTTKEIIEIEYKAGTHKGFRPVKPFSLLPMPNGPVLYSLCLLSNQMKSFKLKYISSIKILTIDDKKRWEEHIKSENVNSEA